MGLPRIAFGTSLGKIIDFTRPPSEFRVNPGPPLTINPTITGATEYVLSPSMSIEVLARFAIEDSQAKRVQLENWWQLVKHGSLWTFTFDSTKTVNTTLTADAAIDATSVVVASNTGIVIGQTYKLVDGPYYQLVTVSGIAGTTISIAATTLNFPFASGSIFRDAYFYHGRILDPNEPSPIVDEETLQTAITASGFTNRFTLLLHFFERLV